MQFNFAPGVQPLTIRGLEDIEADLDDAVRVSEVDGSILANPTGETKVDWVSSQQNAAESGLLRLVLELSV